MTGNTYQQIFDCNTSRPGYVLFAMSSDEGAREEADAIVKMAKRVGLNIKGQRNQEENVHQIQGNLNTASNLGLDIREVVI